MRAMHERNNRKLVAVILDFYSR